MKSKVEIAQTIKKTCMFVDTSCADCPYKGPPTCIDRVISDLRDILDDLSKSDFEVLSEIISRGKRFDFECHEGPRGVMWIKLQNPEARDCLPVNIRFDKKGNIL